VIYSDGVFMASGQNKGDMLKVFLANVKTVPPAAIVFVDDSEKNVKDLEASYKDDARLHVIHYTRMDADVNDFRTNRGRLQKAADEWTELRGTLCRSFGNFCRRKLRVASWNLENLYHATGEDLPGRPGTARSDQDYSDLQRFGRELEADVVALQEVNSIEAIRRVFPEPQWQAFISGKKQQDIDTKQETDGIYTGFVVRSGVKVLGTADLPALGVGHTEGGVTRPARWGLELTVERDGKRLRFISVHLKSSCSHGILDNDNNPDNGFDNPLSAHCTTLAMQIPILDAIVDEREAGADPFFVLGDFNRAFDVDGPRDTLWDRVDDGKPEGARLWRYPFNKGAECWRGTFKYHFAPIDFIVADNRANELVVPRSQGWVTYDETLAARPHKISDHCPVYVDLNWN
jgi:endonuclease/exonuclease/phosphatase family metal-dependent hydrolase